LIDALELLQADIRLREDMEHVRRGYEQLDRGERVRWDPDDGPQRLELARQRAA